MNSDRFTRDPAITQRDLDALRAVTAVTNAGVEHVQRAWAAIDKLNRHYPIVSDEEQQGG